MTLKRPWLLRLAIGTTASAALVLALVLSDDVVWAITYAIWAVLLYEGVLTVVGVGSIQVVRRWKAPLYDGCYRWLAGEPLEVETVLHLSAWSRLWAIRWHARILAQKQRQIPGVQGLLLPGLRRNRVIHRQLASLPRGRYEFGYLEWSVTDAFGLQSVAGRSEAQDVLLVHPRRYPLLFWSQSASTQDTRWVTRPGAGLAEMMSGVRPYRKGDRVNLIHWPATAHRNQIMTRELQAPVRSQVTLCLDTAASNYSSAALFEWAVSVLASLLQHAAKTDVHIVVYVGGRQFEVTRMNTRSVQDSLQGIMDLLASVQVDAGGVRMPAPPVREGFVRGEIIVVSPTWRVMYLSRWGAAFGDGGIRWVVPRLAATNDSTLDFIPSVAPPHPRRIQLAVLPARPDEPIQLKDVALDGQHSRFVDR